MLDVNAEAEKTLSKLDCKITYYFPAAFNNLPIISFYSLTERGWMSTDNEETIQQGTIQVDVWADMPADCGNISLQVNEIMTADGWCREMSMDVPKTDSGIYHRTMRFVKLFNL